MKTKYALNILFTFSLLWLGSVVVFAQKSKKEALQNSLAPATALIDGIANEWADSLFQFNKASQLHYLSANNDSALFIVIKSTTADLRRFLIGGISITVNAAAEKKEAQTITFPIKGYENRLRVNASNRNNNQPGPKAGEALSLFKEIGVSGFSQILDGKIALKNEYGIKAAAGLNKDGLLVCEYTLPIKLLHSDGFKSDNFACQIKVNGLNINSVNPLSNQSLNQGMNTVRPMQNRTPAAEFLEGTGFWFFCRLAVNK